MKHRKRSSRIDQADAELLPRIREIKAAHPFWGYRRVWSYLRYREQIIIGKNRVYRILTEHDLLVTRQNKLKACRTPERSKPKTTVPNELWGIDMTKVFVQSWGWVYLHVVKDWGSKKIVGWQLSARSRTEDWLEALQLALNAQFPDGVREATDGQLKLVSDNGCQPTSTRFMAACSVLEVKQIFTSFNNPKGNADTERVFRTMKEDLIWLQEWTSFQQLYNALERWIEDYNTDFPHSSIDQLTPCQYEQDYINKKSNKHSLIKP